jgi:hypothetical protein
MVLNAGFVLSTRGRENREDVRVRQEKLEIEELRGSIPAWPRRS